jgi:hypothetical protein
LAKRGIENGFIRCGLEGVSRGFQRDGEICCHDSKVVAATGGAAEKDLYYTLPV